jgi:hypothetical protein
MAAHPALQLWCHALQQMVTLNRDLLTRLDAATAQYDEVRCAPCGFEEIFACFGAFFSLA